MRSAGTDLVIAPRAPIGLDGISRRYRPDLVFVTVRAGFDPPRDWQRRQRALPARRVPVPGHATSVSEQPEFVAVHAAHRVVVQSHTTDPAIGSERSRLWLDLLGGEDPADRRQHSVTVEQ